METLLDYIAASTNALDGGLLAQRPDHYRKNYWTIVGIMVLAMFGGIGGSITRDVLLGQWPDALVDPVYLTLVVIFGLVSLFIAFGRGQKFRETFFQVFTAFSLPWYAVVGVEKGLQASWPFLGAIFLGVVGPTAGRFLIDVTCGVPAKQFVRGEWFVVTAILTSVLFIFLRAGAFGYEYALSLELLPATIIAFGFGFVFRMAAIWWAWEEPMPLVPAHLLKGLPGRLTLKEKMQPDWEPEE